MSQNTFDDTLQQIQQLPPAPHQPPLAAQAVQTAADFVRRAHAAQADAGSPAWQPPLVEDGGHGAVVLVWQDGQRVLSLVAKPDATTTWFYEPGAAGYGIDPAELLRQGSATPEDFIRRIWPAWVSGNDPATT